MQFNDKYNTVLYGQVCRLQKDNRQPDFVITLVLIQNNEVVDYTLYYKGSEDRNKDYKKISSKKKL